ncbi:MAG TPA: hypothetical protein PKB15_04870 [Acidimicrobiia bacterium]|nr:hypothetical protein [Acidimicrobiia bacterium]
MNTTTRVRVIAYWCVVAMIALSIYGVSNKSAYAGGTVPPSATSAYPGLDPRLVGVPIIETDLTTALVSLSEAVAHVNSLQEEQSTLRVRISLLATESVRAQEVADIRSAEFDQVNNAWNSLILSQYQGISSEGDGSAQAPDANELRLTHQSARVSDTLREWKEKAQLRKAESAKYVTSVKETLATSQTRINGLAGELVVAQQNAQDKRDVVRSGIPLALIEGLEIPVLTMDAYLRAEKVLSVEKPECALTWWALAGIGRAESNHGRYQGTVLDQTGTVTPSIIGVALNGNGFAAIGDSDQGRFDGDTQWDRAVGPMQFIPGTWNRWGSDGNSDGDINPQNIYDAALAAGKYLCNAARPNMTTEEGRRSAFFAYNYSKSYVDFVAAKGHEYEVLGTGRFNPAPLNPTVPVQ